MKNLLRLKSEASFIHCLAGICVFFAATGLQAAPLRIGIHDKPPYAIKNSNGTWSGISVILWENIANSAKLDYELVEVPYEDIAPRIADGTLDGAVGELEVTSQVEKQLDFTQPYLISSIGIAMGERHWSMAWRAAVLELFNWTIAQVLVGIFLAMLLVSLLIWMLERRHKHGHFRGGISGIGSALWFSAATMTTVGYGDKTPSTLAGRVVAIFWMIVGVLLVSAFTATVASSMSAARLTNSIGRVSDFHHLTCGVLKGSLSASLTEQFGINTIEFESLEAALGALNKKTLQAVVADKNSLLYLQREMARNVPPNHFHVPAFSLREAFIAIPMRSKHPDYEKINEALLDFTSSPAWKATLTQWLGPDPSRL